MAYTTSLVLLIAFTTIAIVPQHTIKGWCVDETTMVPTAPAPTPTPTPSPEDEFLLPGGHHPYVGRTICGKPFYALYREICQKDFPSWTNSIPRNDGNDCCSNPNGWHCRHATHLYGPHSTDICRPNQYRNDPPVMVYGAFQFKGRYPDDLYSFCCGYGCTNADIFVSCWHRIENLL